MLPRESQGAGGRIAAHRAARARALLCVVGLCGAVLGGAATPARAQTPDAFPGTDDPPPVAIAVPEPPDEPDAPLPPPPPVANTFGGAYKQRDEPTGLTFLGLYFARMTRTNVQSSSQLADGQVIGRLFGPNGTTTADEGSSYVEQRYLGFFDYRPPLLGGRVALKAAFEVDFTFGDASNGVKANAGGAINGDVVNLQTKRMAIDVQLMKGLDLSVGLQPLADSAHDPTTVLPDTLMHGGAHLSLWATDAAGINLFYKPHPRLAGRLGWYDLYLNQTSKDDDVQLFMADGELGLGEATRIGAHLWWLRDRSNGVGSALGAGPGSALADYNGALRLPIDPDLAQGDVFWAVLDASHNRWLQGGPLSLSGFLAFNFGGYDVVPGACRAADARVPCTSPVFDDTPADLFAIMADAEAAWRWGRTNGDVVSVEMLYASGDDRPDDRVLSSMVTGNNYGVPGALYGTHRSLLLFPDLKSVNRQVAVVYDPANLGYGVMAGFVNGAVDLIDDTLNLKLGMAVAQAAAAPAGQDRFIGIEGNAELMYRPMPFLWFGLHGGMVRLGKFLEGKVATDPIPEGRPWTTYASLTWVHF